MAFCDQCGREIKAAAKFCAHCGATVSPDPLTAPASGATVQAAASLRSTTTALVTAAPSGATAHTSTSTSTDDTQSKPQTSTPRNPVPDSLDRIAARVSGAAESSRTPSGAVPSTASTSNALLLGYAGGVVLIAVGVYLATITRISTNLLTGQTSTSNPDLGTGIVLIVIGVVIAGGIRLLNGGRRPR
jgi:hypothetical protein